MRLIKSPAEQVYSRKAGKAASEGMRSALAALRAGITEDDLMAAAYQGLFRMHSEFPGLPPLINSGVRHTMAHAMAEGYPVREGDAVYFEVGASIKRYHAATLRIGFVGTPPNFSTILPIFAGARSMLGSRSLSPAIRPKLSIMPRER